jgi:hypothetical protein
MSLAEKIAAPRAASETRIPSDRRAILHRANQGSHHGPLAGFNQSPLPMAILAAQHKSTRSNRCLRHYPDYDHGADES